MDHHPRYIYIYIYIFLVTEKSKIVTGGSAEMVYEFLRAAVTNDHKFSVSQTTHTHSPTLWRSEFLGGYSPGAGRVPFGAPSSPSSSPTRLPVCTRPLPASL